MDIPNVHFFMYINSQVGIVGCCLLTLVTTKADHVQSESFFVLGIQ